MDSAVFEFAPEPRRTVERGEAHGEARHGVVEKHSAERPGSDDVVSCKVEAEGSVVGAERGGRPAVFERGAGGDHDVFDFELHGHGRSAARRLAEKKYKDEPRKRKEMESIKESANKKNKMFSERVRNEIDIFVKKYKSIENC